MMISSRRSSNINGSSSNPKRLMTSHVSMANDIPCVEDYHGRTSAGIPFSWESQPGTPKIKLRESPLPPLTPPPSYFYATAPKAKRPPPAASKKQPTSKANLLDFIFFKRAAARKAASTALPDSPASSSSSSSSSHSSRSSSPWSKSYSYSHSHSHSHSVPSSPLVASKCHRGRYNEISRTSCPRRSSFDYSCRMENDECESPVSTLCYRNNIGRAGASAARSCGCYASMIKALLRDVE